MEGGEGRLEGEVEGKGQRLRKKARVGCGWGSGPWVAYLKQLLEFLDVSPFQFREKPRFQLPLCHTEPVKVLPVGQCPLHSVEV